MKWLTNLFGQQPEKEPTDPMKKYLIACLGNIGAEYVNTRHNIGFKVADHIAKQEGASFETAKLGAMAEVKIKGKTVFLLKPNTYMNLSGKAIKFWLDKENIPVENLLVVTDDLNIPFGTIRIKAKGSDGGHNGLKSTQQLLNTSDYPRFRFGISDEFKKGQQVNYVLGEWDEQEKAKLPERLDMAAEAVKSFVLSGLANTMSSYNGK
jgi:peptidyl-tRNA hydrolase, PTH1 family